MKTTMSIPQEQTPTLPESFYLDDVTRVARRLLGQRLVRRLDDGRRLSGIILETEAYDGREDQACHARVGLTARNAVMFGPPGRAYVYFVYGMHWCLNAVVGVEGYPAAVLIRMLWPVEGLDMIGQNRRGRPMKEWCNGPAKLCQALLIDGRLNGVNLTDSASPLVIEQGFSVPDEWVRVGPRIGVDYAPEPWRSIPWRFTAVIPPEVIAGWGPALPASPAPRE